jgi:hypothetical protein
MLHIDFGLTALRATAFDTWRRRDVFDLADLLSQLSANGQLAGHEAEERFYEIGSTSGFAETERHLRNQTA